MSDFLPWMQLIIAASIILFTSKYLVKHADNIALQTGLGRTFVGIVLLATATSLPELATGINSVYSLNSPDLAAGDVFGSNIFNLLIIVVLDTYYGNRPFLSDIKNISWTLPVLTIIAILIAIIAMWSSNQMNINLGSVGLLSYVIFIFFIISMFITYNQSKNENQESNNEGKNENQESNNEEITNNNPSVKYSLIIYIISASIIIISSVFLSMAGEKIAHIMKWQESFVGTQLLALSTSLPELATSLAALRLRAPELAITNLLGSNLFNTGIVLFLDDIFYTSKPIWQDLSQIHIFNAFIAILMTCTILVTIQIQPKQKLLKFIGIESAILVILYLISTIYTFQSG